MKGLIIGGKRRARRSAESAATFSQTKKKSSMALCYQRLREHCGVRLPRAAGLVRMPSGNRSRVVDTPTTARALPFHQLQPTTFPTKTCGRSCLVVTDCSPSSETRPIANVDPDLSATTRKGLRSVRVVPLKSINRLGAMDGADQHGTDSLNCFTWRMCQHITIPRRLEVHRTIVGGM